MSDRAGTGPSTYAPGGATPLGILFLLALSITVAMEVHKAWWRRRTRAPGGGQPDGG